MALYNPSLQIKDINSQMYQVGKNKFNVYSISNNMGAYIVAGLSGRVGANSSYNLTEFIPVKPSTTYALSYKHTIAWYDKDKNYISESTNSDTNKIQTSPANAAFLRCNVLVPQWAEFQVEEGSANTVFAPFTVTDVVIPDRGIDETKVTFIQPSKNLFNVNSPGTIFNAYVVYNTGGIGASSSYVASDYIRIKPNTYYTPSFQHQLAFYDSGRNYISGLNTNRTEQTFKTPANAVYVRVTFNQATIATAQLEEGSLSTSYVAFGYRFQLENGLQIAVAAEVTIESIQALLQTYRERPVGVAIAPVMYVPSGKEIALYYENIHKYYDDYRGKTDILITDAKVCGRNVKIAPSSTGTLPYTINVANEKFEVILTKAGNIIVSNAAKTTPVKILNEGDSYTLRSTFINPLMASSAAAGVTFLGIRESTASTPTVRAEGRGGYSLFDYVNNVWKTLTRFSPFQQPTGNSYLFYGVTGYWKLVNGAGGYEYDNYPTAIKSMFNASTGYLNSPVTNVSVMYDDTAAKFYVWNGSSWAEIAEATLNFTFNFGKYRQAWGIDQPDIFHSMMGTNDWAGATETQIENNWPNWKTLMDTLIASVHADSPNCKIVIGIPNPPGRQGDDGNLTDERRNRVFWIHANKIINAYSARESEKIYVADYHSTVDRVYGYGNSPEKPFADYSGSDRENYKSDTIHLGLDGFNQMGEQYFGIIQHLR